MEKILQPWQTLKTKEVFVAEPWIRLSVQQVRLPDGRIVDDYYQMKLIDAVVIFAQTDDGRIVMERQYKHGVGKVTLLLPTGGVDQREEPLKAAQRELLEETGYVARDWQCLGQFVQMGNQGGGTTHAFLARHARQVAQPGPSDLEEMEIVLMDVPQLMESVRKGNISVLNAVATIALATNPLFTR